MNREDAIAKTRLTLLRGKTWRYLRYLHFRDAVARVANDVESICVCGAGHGDSELAVAAEYPDITFTLTDIVDTEHGYPNYHATMDLAWKWGIENLKFSVWNVLEPTRRRFDLVASTEMLEHIKDDRAAVANMRQAASKFVYCLVPFADKATNANPVKRKQAWDKHKHHVFGYDETNSASCFRIRCCWRVLTGLGAEGSCASISARSVMRLSGAVFRSWNGLRRPIWYPPSQHRSTMRSV